MTYINMLDRNEYNRSRANDIINTILYAADNFEMTMGSKPTVFMSYDVFAVLCAGAEKYLVVYNIDDHEVNMICGYEIELIKCRSGVLYLGYQLSLPL